MEEKRITYNGSTVFYRVAGKGKTVMLVHGFAEDENVWNHQADFLQAHFRLIIPDLPGSGQSAFMKDADIDTYALMVRQIFDAARSSEDNNDKPILIGHSMGGYIALAFAEKFPGFLEAVGLFHSSAFADDEEKIQTRRKAIGFINTNGAQAFLNTSIPGLFTKTFAAQHTGTVQALIDAGKNFEPQALVQYYEAMIARPDRTNVLKTFEGPLLFILGEHDTAIPLQAGLQQCYLPRESHVHILKESAHMGMLEETAKANQLLLDFLRQTENL